MPVQIYRPCCSTHICYPWTLHAAGILAVLSHFGNNTHTAGGSVHEWPCTDCTDSDNDSEVHLHLGSTSNSRI